MRKDSKNNRPPMEGPTSPTVGKYMDFPILNLPCGEKGFSFGLKKAKAILTYIDEIRKFVANLEQEKK